MPDAFIQESRQLRPASPEEFHILRSISESDFNEILFLASEVCKSRAAAIVISENGENYVKAAKDIDAEWLLSHEKIPKANERQQEKLVISHLESDESLNGYSEKKISFYTGLPLITASGETLGVLCVLNSAKSELSKNQVKSLEILAGKVVKLVEFRKHENEFRRMQKALEQKYQDLERFASVVSHDIKSPLANIISLTELLKEEIKENLSFETTQYLNFLEESSQSLRSYVDGLLKFYRSEKVLEKEEEDVELEPFFNEITALYTVDQDVEITFPKIGTLHNVNKAALSQIFLNLIANGLKYNHKDYRKVEIFFKPSEGFYEFEVRDNGDGIPEENTEKIFDLFTTLEQNDRYGNVGSGIGLATVKKLLDHMGGEISVESSHGIGSNFKFKIKR